MRTKLTTTLAPCPECDYNGPHEVTEDNGGPTVWGWCEGCDTDFEVEASEPETVDLLGALHRSVVTAQGRRAGKSSAIPEPGMHFGDMVVEFNPLTGDLTVTGVQAIGGIAPGKIRLSSKRRDGEGEIGVPG